MSTEHRDPEMDARLVDWANSRTAAPIADATAKTVHLRIESQRQDRRRARLQQGILLAAALVLLFVMFPDTAPPTIEASTHPAPTLVAETPTSPTVLATTNTAIEHPIPTLTVLHTEGTTTSDTMEAIVGPEGRILLALGSDRIGLGPASALQIESAAHADTRVRLDQGVLAAEVSTRGDTGQFTVLAGEAEIEVIGTRFGVIRGDIDQPLRVWVREGIVAVRFGGASWELQADQELVLNPMGFGSVAPLDPDDIELRTLLSTEAPVPEIIETPSVSLPTVEAPPSLDGLRARLGSGEIDEVRNALQTHLDTHPTDVNAWELLATAAQMQGDSVLRLQALEQIIALDTGHIARRARYDAAGLLLLDPDPSATLRAQNLLREFLADPAGPGLLEPEARLALGRSEIDAGNRNAGRIQLQIILEDFVGTGPAVEAAQILAEIPAE